MQAGSQERVEALDTLLWTYREDSFLPHGTFADGPPEEQPIFLTTGEERPNDALIRFFVDGTDAEDLTDYERAIYLFDGRDTGAVEQARAQWAKARDAGYDVTYWQQNDAGKWEQKA